MDYRHKHKAKTIKLLKENIGENLCALGFSKHFLQKAQVIKEKLLNWTSTKFKTMPSKVTVKEMMRQAMD